MTVSGKRRALFFLILACLSWGLLEVASFLMLTVSLRSARGLSKVRAEMIQLAGAEETLASSASRGELRWNDYVEVLHPYFGFVADPSNNRPFWEVSDYGFVSVEASKRFRKRAPEN